MRMPIFFRKQAKPSLEQVDSRLKPLAQNWLRDDKMLCHLVSNDAFQCFRSLDSELLIKFGQREFRLMLASTSAGDGRSTVALVLSVLSAAYAADHMVLYVDASGDAKHSQAIFNVPPQAAGLYDYLENRADFDAVVQKSPLENLSIVSACSADDRRRIFDPHRFESFLAEAGSRYQRIIVDAPPLETHREALSMARVIGNTLLVVRCCRTPRGRAVLALRDLHGVGAKLVGSVLNDRVYPIPGSRPGY
jgi:Mrp family chromosome partitioning ATPase